MKEVQFHLTGVTPLMHHNERLANPLDPFAQRAAAANAQMRRKGVDKLVALREVSLAEWEGGLYIDEKGPFVPAKCLASCLVGGARISRGGRAIQRSVLFPKPAYSLQYDGPRDFAGLRAASKYADQRMVRVGAARVLRTRPIFSEWHVQGPVLYDDRTLALDDLRRYFDDAGRCEGLMEARQLGYGRFTVKLT